VRNQLVIVVVVSTNQIYASDQTVAPRLPLFNLVYPVTMQSLRVAVAINPVDLVDPVPVY
jgi:hypothetical protein